MSKFIYIFFVLISCYAIAQKNDNFIQNVQELQTKTISELENINFDSFTVENYSNAIDVARQMMSDSLNLDSRKRGTILLAILAKNVSVAASERDINFDTEDSIALLDKLASEKYKPHEKRI